MGYAIKYVTCAHYNCSGSNVPGPRITRLPPPPLDSDLRSFWKSLRIATKDDWSESFVVSEEDAIAMYNHLYSTGLSSSRQGLS